MQPQRALLDEAPDDRPEGQYPEESADVDGLLGVGVGIGIAVSAAAVGVVRARVNAVGVADRPHRPGVGGRHESPDVIGLVAQERHGHPR